MISNKSEDQTIAKLFKLVGRREFLEHPVNVCRPASLKDGTKVRAVDLAKQYPDIVDITPELLLPKFLTDQALHERNAQYRAGLSIQRVYPKLYDAINKYFLMHPSAFPPDFVDLTFLLGALRIKRPKRLLELGCGYSSILFSYILTNHYKSHETYTIADGNEFWLQQIESFLKEQNFLTSKIKFNFCKEIEVTVDNKRIPGWSMPDRDPYDLVYVDAGPSKSEYYGMESVLGNLKHGSWVLVDCRTQSLRALCELEGIFRNIKIFHNWFAVTARASLSSVGIQTAGLIPTDTLSAIAVIRR